MLEQIEGGEFIQDLRMNVLQAIQYIIQSWKEVTTETIRNCWHHTKILPDDVEANVDEDADNIDDNIADDVNGDEPEADDIELDDVDPVLNEISKMLETLNLPNSMEAREFLNIPEEDIIYEIPKDDRIITELIEIFKKKSNDNTDALDEDEMDDSVEVATISTNVALNGLKTVHTFLLQQQENVDECIKLVNTIEKFIRRKQTQTTINKYFNL